MQHAVHSPTLGYHRASPMHLLTLGAGTAVVAAVAVLVLPQGVARDKWCLSNGIPGTWRDSRVAVP